MPASELRSKPLTIWATPKHALRVTPVFDTYWRFAVARQDLFFRRLERSSPPWTEDPILSRHRFTNVYRASDRVSQYLIQNVIYEGDQSADEVFFRIILFKLFNRIATWKLLNAELGSVSWRSFDVERYEHVLDSAFARGQRLYSAAYIMPSPAFGATRKHANHLRLIDYMMRDEAPKKAANASSLEEVFRLLRSYPSLGDFLAFQLSIDLNYSTLIDFSEMDFVVAGPGAQNGIMKCFADSSGLSNSDIIRFISEISQSQFERLGLSFQTLWGRPLQLIDCQNLFCEVDKYARVVHPEVAAKFPRTRIKQRFKPTPEPITQWYPPKWNLQPTISRDAGSGRSPLLPPTGALPHEGTLPLFGDVGK